MAIDAKKKRIAGNTAYTIGGALVLNGVLQLLVYPSLAAVLGAEANGTVLYIMALVNILGPSIGQALNNSRLVLRRDMDVTNGDYNCTVLVYSAVGIAGAFLFSHINAPGTISDGGFAAVITVLMLLTIFRYYGDVEYRLSLNYRRYFIYYALCGAGCAAGYLVFRKNGYWPLIFLLGEAAAIAYAAAKGSVFRRFFSVSRFFRPVLTKGGVLVLSYFVTNLTLNIDRVYLKSALGGEAVTVYYVVSLIGKTLVLFIAPVNTVIISYLTREETRVTRSRFLKFSGIGIAVSAVFFLLCEAATPIFIRLFYPSLYEAAAPLITVVTISQILAMLSAYLFIIALTFTGEKWQLLLQTLHLVLVVVLITAVTPRSGLMGFSAAVLAANLIRAAAVIVLGVCKAAQGQGNGPGRVRRSE